MAVSDAHSRLQDGEDWVVCEIALRRRYGSWSFVAVSQGGDREEIGKSQQFRARLGSAAGEETPDAVSCLTGLERQLELAGWELIPEERQPWYGMRFRRELVSLSRRIGAYAPNVGAPVAAPPAPQADPTEEPVAPRPVRTRKPKAPVHEAASAETMRLVVERLEAERLETERLDAEEARREAERLEARRLEAERLEAARLEAGRLVAEQLEAVRLLAQRLKAERLEAERLQAERLEAERLEAERLEAERLEAERLDAERLQAERLEAERLEAERLAAERLEAERVEAERLEAERLEAERIEAERAEEAWREYERLVAKHLQAEEAEHAERERAAAALLSASKVRATAEAAETDPEFRIRERVNSYSFADDHDRTVDVRAILHQARKEPPYGHEVRFGPQH